MGYLSSDLRNLGYEPTGRESPFNDSGEFWKKRCEIVCDETGIVLRNIEVDTTKSNEEKIYRYQNSNKVKMIGGYISSYDWGNSDERFKY